MRCRRSYGWWLPGSGVQPAGLNYVAYDQFGPNGMRMRVGFPVSKSFADTAQVKCLRLAGGRASWEIYGDWVEDQSKLVTDIHFLLA